MQLGTQQFCLKYFQFHRFTTSKKTDYQVFKTNLSFIICTFTTMASQFLVNHLGYHFKGTKKAILQSTENFIPEKFEIVDALGKTVYHGSFTNGGKIENWHTGNAYPAMFSSFDSIGIYQIQCKTDNHDIVSQEFAIDNHALFSLCLPTVLKGLNSQHCAGPYNEKDKESVFFGGRTGFADLSGGWYDASGDKSKYLSHLAYSNFMVPQQTPMLVWNLFEGAALLQSKKSSLYDSLIKEMIAEAVYGAEFLLKMQDPEGYFYMGIFDAWSGDPEKREICAYIGQSGLKTTGYKSAFRQGAGIAIAALAKACHVLKSGHPNCMAFREKAIKGFEHLVEMNTKYTPDGKENLIDVYCSLIASTELHICTSEKTYLDYSRERVVQMASLLQTDETCSDWWCIDFEGKRPYFHAVEAGLPVIALYNYLKIEKDPFCIEVAIKTIAKAVGHQIQLNSQVNNPFGYPRQYVFSKDSFKRVTFFIAQENETGYWWQGENARIMTLSAAFNLVLPYLDKGSRQQAKTFAMDQINWVLGLNPFDVCMVDGLGRNNPDYCENNQSKNYSGGICNGITAGFDDEKDIAFMPLPYTNDPMHRWRWGEQWLPHSAWFILAVVSVKN
jgi:hypothetical protein